MGTGARGAGAASGRTFTRDDTPGGGRSLLTEASDALLVRLAARGSDPAWNELVRRKRGIVRGAGRRMGLCEADIDDVAQATWLRLLSNLPRVRQPESINGWIAVTARREAIRFCNRAQRAVDLEHHVAGERIGCDSGNASPEEAVLAKERRTVLRRAVSRLPRHQGRLLETLMEDEDQPYRHAAAVLRMPVGGIGPTRRRALDQLARERELMALQG